MGDRSFCYHERVYAKFLAIHTRNHFDSMKELLVTVSVQLWTLFDRMFDRSNIASEVGRVCSVIIAIVRRFLAYSGSQAYGGHFKFSTSFWMGLLKITVPHEPANRCIHQTRPVLVRDLSVFGQVVYLQVPRRQFYCSSCKTSPTEPLSWLNKRQRQTNRYQEYI